MSILAGLLKKGGAVDNVLKIADKAVPDRDKANELKMQLLQLISTLQSPITRYVRAILAIMFMAVWLFFPEKMEGREEATKYVLYAIMGFYFLADFTIDKWKSKNK